MREKKHYNEFRITYSDSTFASIHAPVASIEQCDRYPQESNNLAVIETNGLKSDSPPGFRGIAERCLRDKPAVLR